MKINLTRQNLITYGITFLLAVGTIICAIFFRHIPFWGKLIIYIGVSLVAVLTVALGLFNFEKTSKMLFMLIACLAVFAIIYLALEFTGFMDIFVVEEGCNDKSACISENMRVYLGSTGKWSPIVFVVLQFLQTTILPIPSSIVTAAGSLFFSSAYGTVVGAVLGSLFSLIGILIGSFLTFFFGRKYGIKLVVWIVGKGSLKKVLTMLKGKDVIILTLMFILPFFPDDILCFVAGMSSMSWLYYTVLILISRVMVVFGTSFLVNLIPFTTWWGIMIWAIFLILVVLAFYFSVKKGDKILDHIRYKIFKLKKNENKKPDYIEKLLDDLETCKEENFSKTSVEIKKTDLRL